MPLHRCQISFASPADATSYAALLGGKLVVGDTLLLEGNVGAGKTHFARSLIQSQLTQPEDVPSPTFTLVQTYDTQAGEIWHADLYRLTSTLEIEELGLIEAFETAICIVEWPDRLGTLLPESALTLELRPGDTEDSRDVVLSWRAPKWQEKIDTWIC